MKIVQILLLLVVILVAGPVGCVHVRYVDIPQSQGVGQGQQPQQGGWIKTDLEVGQDHHKGDVSIEVGSHELTQEEKLALQAVLTEKAKKNHSGHLTKERVLAWGREVETKPFDVRLTDKETGKPVYEPYSTPKVVRQAWVPAEKVPGDIRRQYRVLPPTYGGQ